MTTPLTPRTRPVHPGPTDTAGPVEIVSAEVPIDCWATTLDCWARLRAGLRMTGACESTETYHTPTDDGGVMAVFAVVWSGTDDSWAVHGSGYSLDRMLRALGLPDRVRLQLVRRFPDMGDAMHTGPEKTVGLETGSP